MSKRKIKNVKILGGQKGRVLGHRKMSKIWVGAPERKGKKIWVGKGEVEGRVLAPKGEEEGRVLGGTGKWKKPRAGRRDWEEGRVAGHRKWKRKKSGRGRARKKEGFWHQKQEKIWVGALRGVEKKDGCMPVRSGF